MRKWFGGVEMRFARLMTGAAIIAIATPILASETITYTYDAKGRLTKVLRTGTVNNTVTAQYAYDKADNRSTVSTTGSPNGTPTPPPPPPPSSNLPPVANADSVSLPCNSSIAKNLTANDTDPEGNLPLTVQSVTVNSGTASASIASASSVTIFAATLAGTSQGSYVVRDSLGATATGTLTIITTGTTAQCLQ